VNERSSRPAPLYHPLLIAAYPVIALLAHNIEEIKVVVALRALALSLLAGILLYAAIRTLLKDRDKAALLTTLMLVLFFSYGHVYNFLKLAPVGSVSLGRHRLLAPLWLGASVVSILWVKRTARSLQTWNRLLNLVAIVALVLPIAQIGLFFGRVLTASAETPAQVNISGLHLPSNQPPPDVYYIILDAYARDDTLKAEFDLEITPFLSQLETMGFYVARCAQSNYVQTQLSLASSLNMDYLQALDPKYSPGQTSRVGMEELIHHSAVRKAFESLGYQIVAFETGFKGTQWEDADVYLSPSSDVFHAMQIAGGPNGFEVMLLRTSAGLLLSDGVNVLPKFLQPDFDNPRKIHRDLILYDLEQLSELPDRPGQKFVFAHLVIPHPPYVFGPNGEFTDTDIDYERGYRDQVIYLNKRLLELLPRMIASSPTPPVIILQGDHGSIGSKPNTRTTIFNAYYLPGGSAQALHDDISPVNTFRVVFNTLFGGNYSLLDDVSYYSVYSTPFEFTVIPNKRAGCQP
jgi:hypothetical protein